MENKIIAVMLKFIKYAAIACLVFAGIVIIISIIASIPK